MVKHPPELAKALAFLTRQGAGEGARDQRSKRRFDPDRFTAERERLLPRQAYMPFGAGSRTCIGHHFALVEAQLVVATWNHALRFEVTSDTHPGYEPLLTLRPASPIPMRVHARHAFRSMSDPLEDRAADGGIAPNPAGLHGAR